MSNEAVNCPDCGAALEKKDWVKRSKVHAGGNKTWRWIEVRKCVNCGRNHRLIPDDQVPYKHYEGVLIEKVVDGALSEDDMLEIENYPCDDTMARWAAWAEQLKKNAEGDMRLLLHKLSDLKGVLTTTETSLLEGIKHRVQKGLMAVAIRLIINFGGTGLMPDSS